jgi:polyphosphate kinase
MSALDRPVAVAEPSTADAVVAKAQVVRARSPQPTRAATPEAELANASLYINRELSLLEFNRRVLAQAQDPETPLLERLRFLTICSSNLDEFFEIRMAGVKQQISFNLTTPSPDGMSAQELDRRISEVAHGLVDDQYRVLNEELLPALEREGIFVSRRDSFAEGGRQEWLKQHFQREVMPVLTPVGLDPAHPFPRVLNKSLNFAVTVEGVDAFGRDCDYAVVQAPRSLPRVVRLPQEIARGPYDFALLSSIIHENVGELFPGMKVTGCYQFRLTRNSELWVEEEEVDDLLHALEGELTQRNWGDSVRLEVADNCPPEIRTFLQEQFDLKPEDVYQVNGPVNFSRLAQLYDLVDRAELKFPAFVPSTPRAFSYSTDMFDSLRRGDVLMHHPYESFQPVLELLRQAAKDPEVLAIKQTLYRTGADSPIVSALIDAARAGKEVTAVVELRARFDEAANIDLATRLQNAGANVLYGIVGYKAHAKMLHIVRREGKGLRYYTHLGTGNYHVKTARAYTDFSYMTASREIGEDVHKIFLQLTGLGRVTKLKKLIQSPFTLQPRLLELIDGEIEYAKAGKPARIVAKLNSLSEPGIIGALYKASQAGVTIDLLVRGVCGLRPGIPGVSDNIQVRSLIGRFLEHSRVYYFNAGGAEIMYCSSADWMNRNFFRRVEVAFPIEDPLLKRRVYDEAIGKPLEDNTQAWVLQPSGTYERSRGDGKPRAAQTILLGQLSEKQAPVDEKSENGEKRKKKKKHRHRDLM